MATKLFRVSSTKMAEDSEQKQQYVEQSYKLKNPVFSKVMDLSPTSVGFNLIVKVGKIKPIMIYESFKFRWYTFKNIRSNYW